MSKPEAATAEPFEVVGKKPERFSITVRPEESYEAGEWRKLPCGLEVLAAPSGTTESDRVLASLLKKRGNGAKSIDDLGADKQRELLDAVMARVNFKGFRDPQGSTKVLFDEVDAEGRSIGSVEYDSEKVADREKVLAIPMIRRQWADLYRAVTLEYGTEVEEAGKN